MHMNSCECVCKYVHVYTYVYLNIYTHTIYVCISMCMGNHFGHFEGPGACSSPGAEASQLSEAGFSSRELRSELRRFPKSRSRYHWQTRAGNKSIIGCTDYVRINMHLMCIYIHMYA